MNKKALIKLINENTNKINQKHLLIKKTFEHRDIDPEAWSQATKDFHSTYDQLAFPGGLEHALKNLKNKDPGTIEIAIIYLEVDPYYFRSGYIKTKVIRLLKHVELPSKVAEKILKKK